MDTLFNIIPRLAWRLSGEYTGQFLVTLLRLWWFMITRRLSRFQQGFSINIYFNNTAISIILRHPMDLAVLREIYLDKEYEWFPHGEPKTIIDLGAHFGDTALYYHALFPNARIIAVEPAPETYARLVENTEHILQITALQSAISDTDGEIELHIMPSSLGNSLIQRKGTTNVVRVSSIKLATLLKKYELDGVDLLKFDIEGAEFPIFSDKEATICSKAYIGEVHEDLAEKTIEEFKGFFEGRKIIVEQLNNKKRYVVKIV